MSELAVGMLFFALTLLAMFSGLPVAYALGGVAAVFMFFFMPAAALDTVAQNVYEEMASITLLSIILFILKGIAIGKSPVSRDLYTAIHVWFHKIPGGLGVANTIACTLFAAMAGSSPATCAAIGSFGIPEMRRRGYSPGFAAGLIAAGGTLGILLPPSVTMILYAIASSQSLGRLFLAGIGPGLMMMVLFAGYAMWKAKKEKNQALALFKEKGIESGYLHQQQFTFREKLSTMPRVLPFVILLISVMVALYGGYATPSETAGLGVVIALGMIILIYRMWRWQDFRPMFYSTLKESSMLMLIVGMSEFYSYVMSYLYISQSMAHWIVALHLSKWLLLAMILFIVVILGFFLPPVSIIVMTVPIILPPLQTAGFDLIWFGIAMTLVMEMGLIHPPVGLNIFIIRSIAPDISLWELIVGIFPFIILLMIGVLLLCIFPSIALWLPNKILGAPLR